MPKNNTPLFEKIEKLCQGELFRKVFSDEDVPTYNSENGSLENVTEDVHNILKEVFDVEQLSINAFETVNDTFIVPVFEASNKKTINIIKKLEEKLKALDEDLVRVDEVQESLEDDFVLTKMSTPLEEKRISWVPKPSENIKNNFFKGPNLKKPEDDFQSFISRCSGNKKMTNLLFQASEKELEALRRAVTGEGSAPSTKP